jgi:hypothetical protein
VYKITFITKRVLQFSICKDFAEIVTALAAAGQHVYALNTLEALYDSKGKLTPQSVRYDRNLPEFICRLETQGFFEAKKLPPLKVPYPCGELQSK